MESSNERDPLDQLKRQLYGPLGALRRLRRSSLDSDGNESIGGWRHVEKIQTATGALSYRLLKRLVLVGGIVFLLGILAVLLVFLRGNNLVSSGNVMFKIDGPTEVAAGEELSLQVAVQNRNQAVLELADLIVEYPAGSRAPGPDGAPLTRERLSLGNIKPGDEVSKQLRLVLFGEQGSEQELKLSVEYRLPDSSAIFDKEFTQKILINSTPLSVQLDVPEELNNNQEFVIQATITSNAANEMVDPVVVLQYPAGFRFLSAVPSPTRGQNVWSLGSLRPGGQVRLAIRGTLEGQDDEQKSVRLSAGTLASAAGDDLSATYGSALSVVTIRRPLVSLTTKINGSSASEVVADSRQPVSVELSWVNNGSDPVNDGVLTLKLDSPLIDKTSIQAERGYYNSAANTVTWTKQNVRDLTSLDQGDSGLARVSFSTISLVDGTGSGLRQPQLSLAAEWRGQRVSDQGKPESVFARSQQVVKLASVAQFAGKVLRDTGALENRGPIPPKVDEETTYTVVWSVLNSSSNLNNARVSATLPAYVEWLGVQSPLSEPLTFRANSGGGGELVWDLGQVAAGVGTESAPREVSFQVGIKPSLSQVGTVPELVLGSKFTGVDAFTKQAVEVSLRRELSTEFSSEANFNLNDGRVVK